MGENPAMSDPDLNHARKALSKLEHLVVQDIFLTETAMYADIILPASAFPEKTGTFTNTDRRVQLGRQADHHDRGETHFWELENVGCPNTGWGYFVVFFIALVPPIWHWYMRKRLAAWDEHFATDEERAIAARLNKEVGYEGTPFAGDVLADAGNVDLGLRSAKK